LGKFLIFLLHLAPVVSNTIHRELWQFILANPGKTGKVVVYMCASMTRHKLLAASNTLLHYRIPQMMNLTTVNAATNIHCATVSEAGNDSN